MGAWHPVSSLLRVYDLPPVRVRLAAPCFVLPASRFGRSLPAHVGCTPLSNQVTEYVRQHAAAVRTDPGKYLSAIQEATSLVDLTRNPFLLTLFVAALPKLSATATGPAHVTRYRVYEAFVAQWFEQRGVARLAAKVAAEVRGPDAAGTASGDLAGTVATGTDTSTVGARFELLSALLAGEMLRLPELGLAVTLEDGDKSWKAVTDTAEAWLADPVLHAVRSTDAYQRASKRRKRAQEDLVTNSMDATVDVFAYTCPLRLVGTRAQFIHKSFMEYFCARLVLLAAAG